jgi:hypothetical protein
VSFCKLLREESTTQLAMRKAIHPPDLRRASLTTVQPRTTCIHEMCLRLEPGLRIVNKLLAVNTTKPVHLL